MLRSNPLHPLLKLLVRQPILPRVCPTLKILPPPKLKLGRNIQFAPLEIIENLHVLTIGGQIVPGLQAEIQVDGTVVRQPPVSVDALHLHIGKRIVNFQPPTSPEPENRFLCKPFLFPFSSPPNSPC